MKICSLKFLSLFLFFSSLSLAAKLVDRTLVTVNEDVILESDVDNFMRKIKSKSYQELFGGVDPRVLQSREMALQLLVEEKIINQQVKKLELQANDQEVEGQIRAITKRNGISPAQLEDRLKQLGTSMADYKEGIRRQIERRNLIDREIRPSMELTEEQLRHYYLRSAKADDLQAEYKIAHILIAKKGGVASKERAKTVYGEVLKRPQDFEAIAKEYSDDTSTSEAGGVLGYFSPSSLSKEFREAVPKTPLGGVTAPFKTGSGLHIVKVLEVRSSDFAQIPKERKEALRNQMMMEETEKKMVLWLDRKKTEAHIKRFNNATNSK